MSAQNFWPWALTQWRDPDLERALLALQDQHGLVVLELLYVAWLASIGRALSETQWRALVEAANPWVAEVVIPLREQRQRWRGVSDRDDLRKRLQGLELAAERELAGIYAQALASIDGHSPDAAEASDRAVVANPGTIEAWSSASKAALTVNIGHVITRAEPPVTDTDVEALIRRLTGSEP